MSPWPWLLVSYLLGAFPSSYVAGRLARGIDLRDHGSGNLGATNAFRVLGARIAAPVMLADAAKGFLPVWLFPQWNGGDAWGWALAYGAAAILGHVFPVYMGFRGGKGVATSAGVFLALAPVALGIALLVWLGVLRASRMVSLASLASAATLATVLFAMEQRLAVRLFGLAAALFVVYAHRANIGRIRRGEESRFGGDRSAAAASPRLAENSARTEEPR